MSKGQYVGVSFVAFALAAGTASAGTPKWCQEGLESKDASALKGDDVRAQLKVIAYAKCRPDHFQGKVADVDAAYAKVSARLGLGDDDWADVMNWIQAVYGAFNGLAAPSKKPWGQLDAFEQYAGFTHHDIMNGETDRAYFADALGPKLTELGRMAYIELCVKSHKPVDWAMCQGDIDAFDAKKALAEAKDLKTHKGAERIELRLHVDELKQTLAEHAADVKKLLAKDPVYVQVFDIAKKERADWDARYKANSEPLQVQVAIEDAVVTDSRHALEGCGEKTWKALQGTISKIPAKDFVSHRTDDLAAVFMTGERERFGAALVTHPESYLAANARGMCAKADEKNLDEVAKAILGNSTRIPGFRGPRTSTSTRILLANLQPDDRSEKIDIPDMHRPWLSGTYGSWSGGGFGIVTKVSTKGDKTHIEFQQHKHSEYVSTGCVATNHIQSIRDNGEVVYDYKCSGSKLLTSMTGPNPIDVRADTAKGVKTGMAVTAFDDEIFFAFPDAKNETPVLVLGEPVK